MQRLGQENASRDSHLKGHSEMTPKQLLGFARFLGNVDFNELADAGVLLRGHQGGPATGGSSWERFNRDFVTFVMKLPPGRLTKLCDLRQKLRPRSKEFFG